MSSHLTSYHVTSCHVTSQHQNVVTLERRDVRHQHRDVSGIFEQRRDVGHECRDVAVFSSDEKVLKFQSLGLLLTSKLFLLHINHLRSSHDHIHKEQHWI